MRAVLLLLLVAAAAALHVACAGSFDPSRVHLVDWKRTPQGITNFIFRGNEPRNGTDGPFAYEALRDEMTKKCASEGNCQLPSIFYLVDINLEQWLSPDEDKDMKMEEQFFADHPELGEYVHWLTVGSLIDPNRLSSSLRDTLVKTMQDWEADRLMERVPALNAYLDSARNVSTVVYFHCEAGEDRTGEMAGSYYMQFLRWSFTKALDYDNHIESREIHTESKHAMQWYCFYLQIVKGYPSMPCA